MTGLDASSREVITGEVGDCPRFRIEQMVMAPDFQVYLGHVRCL